MGRYITPCVTAMKKDGTIDYAGQEAVFAHLIKGGIDGVVILGSIGEFFAFSMEEKKAFIDFAAKTIGNQMQIIVGTTSMVQSEIISLTCYAYEKGIEHCIILPPYYFTYKQESILQYYKVLAQQLPGKLFLYNFPQRTGNVLSPEIVQELALEYDNIVGCKDTIAGMDHTNALIKSVKSQRPDFEIYSGFDDNCAYNILSGGNGCIGGLSNIFPSLFTAWAKACNENNMLETMRIQQIVNGLMDIYGVGMPFVPYIKKSMMLQGIGIEATASFPMPTVTAAEAEKLRILLDENNIFSR